MADRSARFLIVVFTWRGIPKTTDLEPSFNLALDWLRIAPNTWIMWSNSEIQIWNDRLKKQMSDQDSVLIAELNLSHTPDTFSGYQKEWIWTWIQKSR